MRWRIRRTVIGRAAKQLVARRDVIAPELISYGAVIRAINRKLCLSRARQIVAAVRQSAVIPVQASTQQRRSHVASCRGVG